ncbi:unnamed protein product [Discosporangium mesarthrocarpum]
MSLSWYTQQARLHLQDQNTYTHIPNWERVSARIQRFSRILSKTPFCFHTLIWISNYLHHKLDGGQIQVPYFYIIPKVHKSPISSRPIAAGHSWWTQPVSLVIAHFLQQTLPSKPTVLKDSRSLIRRLESTAFNPQDQLTLITADVSSLYPSLNVRTVIWRTMSAVKRFYKDFWPPQMFSLFVRFLRFVLHNNFVQFDQDVFHQIFGQPWVLQQHQIWLTSHWLKSKLSYCQTSHKYSSLSDI